MIKYSIHLFYLLLIYSNATGQEQLSIGTANPVMPLEISGSADQFLRIQSTLSAGVAGVELMRGDDNLSANDWRITNDGGALKFAVSGNGFGLTEELIRITTSDNIGIGTQIAAAPLHLDGGTQFISGGMGYLKLGLQNNLNMAFDNYSIRANDGNAPTSLNLQPTGGHTNFGLNGGHTFMAQNGGAVGVGTVTLDAALNIDDPGFQLYLRNDTDGDVNDWYIGATNANWLAGDRQLLFSPTSNSTDAKLRLLDISENDGTEAPVMIVQTYDHTLLIDGNEIDTRGTPLYINHNTDEHTFLNPSGGRVGIGTTNPQAMLHVVGSNAGNVLTLQRDNTDWQINPSTGGTQNLLWVWNNGGIPYAEIHGQTGAWIPISDRRYKKDLLPLGSVLEDVKALKTYTYQFKNDEKHKTHIGIIAQEAESIFPEIVHENEGHYGVAYAQLAVIGIKALQEQQELITELKAKIEKLKILKKEGTINPASVQID